MLQRRFFHVDYVDIWFRSRVDCPLRRVGIFRHESSFIPVMVASIRFSLGKAALESIIFEPLSEAEPELETAVAEIMPVELSSRRNQFEGGFNMLDFMLKRSHLFGFEWDLPSERLVMVLAMTSSWQYGQRGVNSINTALFAYHQPPLLSFSL